MLRLTTKVDSDFLAAMLYEAVNWRETGDETRPPLEEMLADPQMARYVEGWGRPGDAALVAVDRADEPVGAAWYRFFTADAPGYGFVGEQVPEVSIGVYPEVRGQGIGHLLLGGLIARARSEGVQSLSLSVAEDNPARRLYESIGFEVVATGGGSLTMVVDLVSRLDLRR